MKAFYTAKDYSGNLKSGEVNVKDERELANQLKTEGFSLTSFKEVGAGKKGLSFLSKINFSTISVKEKMIFTQNLSVMISSGLPLSKAIGNLADQTRNKRLIRILRETQEDIQKGNTFADSLTKYPSVFNELFVNMIRVGETSGNLEEVLNILAEQLEKEHELISKVRGALIYPAVILVAMVGIGIIMMIYVVPQITSVFSQLNATLPATTQFIIALSNALRSKYILIIIAFAAFLIILKVFLSTNIGKQTLGFLVLKTPAIKNIVVKINCARFARIYSSLLKSGVPVVETLNILSRTLTNFYYKNAMKEAAENVQKGINLSKVLYKKTKIFPILVPQMVEVGEETGKTEAVLLKLAQFYEEEVNQITKNLSSIIEPMLMLIIGSAVGFFAVSILQPMYSVLESIK